MTRQIEIEYYEVNELSPYGNNSRTHSESQIDQLVASISEFGFTNPILIDENAIIIAGHGRLEAAKQLGISEVPTITLAGLTDEQKQAYVIADNKLALNAGWDESLLKIELEGLKSVGFDVSLTGFSNEELRDLLGVGDGNSDELEYSKKINTPTYTPKGDKPEFAAMVNTEKFELMAHKIRESILSDEEKEFLLTAARRHIVFDYHQIAEYYCHASIEMQELMEESALVIIDFDKAIENGYVVMSKQLEGIYFDTYEGADDDEA
jgi:hypothetical protein